jgi:hypothetical protein
MAESILIGAPGDQVELGNYVRVNEGEGFDPHGQGQFIEPGFSDSPFGEGQDLISVDSRNREWVIPVLFKAQTAARTNLISNPSFEVDVNGWSGGPISNSTVTTFASQTGWAKVGQSSARLTFTHSASGFAYEGSDRTTFLVSPGQTVRVRASLNVLTLSGGGNTHGFLRWINAGGSVISQTQFGVSSALGERDIASGPLVAPALTVSADILIGVAQTGAGTTDMYFDAVLGTTDTNDAYFDGDTAGCKWTGTRGLSTSTTWVGKDGLHNLVEAVNRRLGSTGCQLVYRDHAASTYTYFDVVFARFEPDFNFRRSQFNYAQGVVRLQVRPFGHTGTTRIIATGQGSLPYLVVPLASGVIDGDWPAKAEVTVGGASQNAPLGEQAFGAAVLPHPSYPVFLGASLLQGGNPVSGGLAIDPISPSNGSVYQILETWNPQRFRIPVSLASVLSGARHRVLGIMRNGPTPGTAALATTVLYGFVDLGVLSVPSKLSPSYSLGLSIGRISDDGLQAGAHEPDNYSAIYGVLLTPEDTTVLAIDRPGRPDPLVQDEFNSATYYATDIAGRVDSLGNTWPGTGSVILGAASVYKAIASSAMRVRTDRGGFMAGPSVNVATCGVTFQADPVVGVGRERVRTTWVQGGVPVASMTTVIQKAIGYDTPTVVSAPTQYHYAVRMAGGATITTFSLDRNGAILSRATISTTDTNIQSEWSMDMWLTPTSVVGRLFCSGRIGASPIYQLTASAANHLTAGRWQVGLSGGYQGTDDGPIMKSYARDSLAGVPQDHLAGDTITFGPDDTVRYNAASQVQEVADDVRRGPAPRLSPSAAALAVFSLPLDGGVSSDNLTARVAVKEFFRYSR